MSPAGQQAPPLVPARAPPRPRSRGTALSARAVTTICVRQDRPREMRGWGSRRRQKGGNLEGTGAVSTDSNVAHPAGGGRPAAGPAHRSGHPNLPAHTEPVGDVLLLACLPFSPIPACVCGFLACAAPWACVAPCPPSICPADCARENLWCVHVPVCARLGVRAHFFVWKEGDNKWRERSTKSRARGKKRRRQRRRGWRRWGRKGGGRSTSRRNAGR